MVAAHQLVIGDAVTRAHRDLPAARLPEGQDAADLIAAGRDVELQEAPIKAAPHPWSESSDSF